MTHGAIAVGRSSVGAELQHSPRRSLLLFGALASTLILFGGPRYFVCVDTLFVGGDTRYGLGRLRRATFDYVKKGGAFGGAVTLDADAPQVTLCNTWAHAHGQASLCGALELLGGWDRGTLRSLDQTAHLWQPGSHASTETTWAIGADGVWRATS